MFKHSLALDSLNPYTWRVAADAYAGDQKDSIAIRYYWRSIGLDSANSDLYNQLCLAYYRLGMMREALSAVGNAIRIYNGNKVYFYNYGFISLELADTLKAEEYFQLSIKVDPKYADGLYQLARVKAMLGKKTDAIKRLNEATSNATYSRQAIEDDPVFANLKNEKAFQDILKRLK
jgi:Putative Zn-dependent protease, contains TPR repeats